MSNHHSKLITMLAKAANVEETTIERRLKEFRENGIL